jgi:hypothetical protein
MKVYRGVDIQYHAFYQESRLKRTAAQLSSSVANSNLGRDNDYRNWGRGDFTLSASNKAMTASFHTLSNSITVNHLTIRHYISDPESIVIQILI